MKEFVLNKNVHLALLSLIVIFIPIHRSFANISIIIAFLVSLYVFYENYKNFNRSFNFIIIFPLLIYTNILINGLFGYNYNELWKQLDKNILSLIIPVILIVLYKKSYKEKIYKSFTYLLAVTTLILLANNLYKFSTGQDSYSLYFHSFTTLVGEHAVYFSLYLSLAIFICIHQLELKIYTKVNRFLIFIFSLGLLFCASKAILLITIFLVVGYFLFSKKLSIKKIIVFLSIISISIISLLNSPYLKDRFVDGFTYNLDFKPTNQIEKAHVFSNLEIDEISDLELRVIFAKLSLYHLVDDNKLLFGYGASDYQDHLDYYYMYYGLAPFHYEGYSPHNQYVYLLVSSGIIGLLFFLIYIFYSFYIALRGGNSLHVLFLLLMCAAMFFETYLLRTKGIIFFFFFNSFFLINSQQYENRDIRK